MLFVPFPQIKQFIVVHNNLIGWGSSSEISGAANHWARTCLFHVSRSSGKNNEISNVLGTKIKIFNWLGGKTF